MKLLHICSDYPFTNVYRELISIIDKSGHDQIIYIPVKRDIDKGVRIDGTLSNTKYVYSKAFSNLDRLFYYTKLNKLYRDVKLNVDLRDIDLIHAHFLFSLGGVAYKLKKEMGIGYSVSIRNVDVNYFFKYGLWLREYAIKIMAEANNVIFISPSYKKRVFENYIPRTYWRDIDQKSIILPNGVNEYWLENKISITKIMKENEIRLIYAGELNKNKNIKTSIMVTKKLIEKGYKATLKIIGKGPHEKKIISLAAKNDSIILFYGFVSDRRELKKLYSESDIFIMPSITETFGVVYVEAMSQGLPVIYSRGEGIDGYYPNGEVGYGVNPRNVGEIVKRIEDICVNYEQMSKRCRDEACKFSWDNIGTSYVTKMLNPLEKHYDSKNSNGSR